MPMRPSRLRHRQRGGVTAVAVRQSWLRNSLAATAAPLRLRHVGRGRAAYTKDVSPTAPQGCKRRWGQPRRGITAAP
jgi:hypothetical protein